MPFLKAAIADFRAEKKFVGSEQYSSGSIYGDVIERLELVLKKETTLLEAELKEAFLAGREHKPKKSESGYWLQFYTWDTFDDWYKTRGEKL